VQEEIGKKGGEMEDLEKLEVDEVEEEKKEKEQEKRWKEYEEKMKEKIARLDHLYLNRSILTFDCFKNITLP
jgi:hypothetical protein